jgi:predicted HicB family RNase H-like nuclease
MELTPYLDTLRRELSAAAAPGGPDATRVADLLSGSIDAAARLCLLEALSDATAEITRKLETTSVEVRLRGRDADFVVTDLAEPAAAAAAPAEPPADSGDLARITLRLPEPLKAQVERAAAGEGISVNAWLVRAVATAVAGGPPAPPGGHRGARGRRVVGFAQA